MIPSLELHWLARHDKDILLPAIIFAPGNLDFAGVRCGGCYYRPQEGEFLYGDSFVDFKRGVIVVGTEDGEQVPGAIAHEWRHHWQFHRGILPDKHNFNADDFSTVDGYGAAVRKYFRTQSHEMDALLYQQNACRDWWSDYAMDLTFGV